MIKCKDFVNHLSHHPEQKWYKRPKMLMHYAICIHCRRYVEQLKILKTSFQNHFKLKSEKDHSLEVKKIEDKVLKNLFQETKGD